MNPRLLICTDLDRTLLPNGPYPESAMARPAFSRLAARDDVDIAYVSGRHRELVLAAIDEYRIPVPDYVIGDVGSSIYATAGGQWTANTAWQQQIAGDWNGYSHDQLAALLDDFELLQLQEKAKQNTYKLSYYAAPDIDTDQLLQAMQSRLSARQIKASLIWSIDETTDTGLLDVLPQQATKLHAIEFLMQTAGYHHDYTVFAGDSGNDLPVLTSHVQSVLVANASEPVRESAVTTAHANGYSDALYVARGDFLGMNGNYAAGILEGVAHYVPDSLDWIRQAIA